MHGKYFTHSVCLECGHVIPADAMKDMCPACGSGWIDARYDYATVSKQWEQGLDLRITSLWRYLDLLPLPEHDPEVSMQEGLTPLIRLYSYERMYEHRPIYIKDERQGPTSSFKDRQAALGVTALKRAGIKACVLASTGNAGAAYAAYCARAGIKLWLFLTDIVPAEKLREAALYGAEVVRVAGTYDEAKKVAAEFARRKGLHFDKGARAIPGKESMKTLAFEIADQLGLAMNDGRRWIAPDWYIQAVSGGIGPLGVWKGFSELYQMGLIDKMPRMGVIQAAGCAPMVAAYEQGLEQAPPVTPKTLIHVLATADPGYSYTLLRGIVQQSHGVMLSIEDGDTFAAMRKAATSAGLSVEPATAVAFAGLERLLYEGIIEPDERVVLNCSGHTFPAESHVLGDQYLLDVELKQSHQTRYPIEGLGTALANLDEQAVSVLVVDDNSNDRRLIRRMLKTYRNYRIFEARNGKEALRVIETHTPHVVITDLTMPDMDGITLIEQIKWNSATQHIPILVFTAKSLSPTDYEALGRYADSIWIKGDFESRDFVRRIVSKAQGESAAAETLPKNVVTDAETFKSQLADYRVVIIEPDTTRTSTISDVLQGAGATIVGSSETGRNGLKLIHEYKPDVVLISAHLDDIPASDIVQAVRRDRDLKATGLIVCHDDSLPKADISDYAQQQALTLTYDLLRKKDLILTFYTAIDLIQSM